MRTSIITPLLATLLLGSCFATPESSSAERITAPDAEWERVARVSTQQIDKGSFDLWQDIGGTDTLVGYAWQGRATVLGITFTAEIYYLDKARYRRPGVHGALRYVHRSQPIGRLDHSKYNITIFHLRTHGSTCPPERNVGGKNYMLGDGRFVLMQASMDAGRVWSEPGQKVWFMSKANYRRPGSTYPDVTTGFLPPDPVGSLQSFCDSLALSDYDIEDLDELWSN